MDEFTRQHCLTLCKRAQEAQGEEQLRLLLELRQQLNIAHALATTPEPEADATDDHGPDGLQAPVIGMDSAGYVTAWNRGAQRLFGYSPEEAIGQHILFLYADEDGDAGIHELFLNHGSPLIEVKRRKKSGEVFRAKLALTHQYNDQGESIGLCARFSQVADNLSPEERRRLHSSIIDDSDEGILIIDRHEQIVSVNAAFSRITGFTSGEVVGQSCALLLSGMHGNNLHELLHQAIHAGCAWHGEIVGKRKNGELFPQSVSIGTVRDNANAVSHAFVIFSDISVLRATEERMKHLVNYDSLTGLPNRSLFGQLFAQALSSARREQEYGALLVIDLNRFATVNDTLGHEVGDELLRQVGQRLRTTLREEDILARIGGDEFVVALVHIQKREHGGLVAEKLLASLTSPFVIDSHALHIDAAVGISVYPEDGHDVTTLHRNADVAMKRAQKNRDSGYLFYSPEMNRRAKEQWQLEGELRQALGQRQLVLHFQPKASLRSGRMVGAEALVRWSHPTRGMVPPSKFIALAEETGLILDVGHWILEEACRQIRDWLDQGIKLVPIAVNLSPRQFDPQLPERLAGLIARHAVPVELLRLEITENMLMQDPEKVIEIMNRLAAQGFGLALDDFGTGYSSLAYLKKFPISTLKIDRSFVIGVPQDENDCAIAQAIVTMGKQLRQEIVAEGVETREQMNYLRQLGCDQLQGYLYSPPLATAEFLRLLTEDRRLQLDA